MVEVMAVARILAALALTQSKDDRRRDVPRHEMQVGS
jgi:hypothetical protein